MCRGVSHGGRRCPAEATSASRQRAAVRNRGARLRRQLAAEGLTVTHGRNTPITYTAIAGDQPFDPDRFEPVRDTTTIKPMGGLWTAPPLHTDDDGITTTWMSWAHDELEREPPAVLTPVTAAGGAVIIHIDSSDDLDIVTRLYPPKPPTEEEVYLESQGYPRNHPPWSYEAMDAAGVTGVRVTERAVREVPEVFGWDVDSTVWLSADHLMTHQQVPAAPPRVDTRPPPDEQDRTVGGRYTPDQVEDYGERLITLDFRSVQEAFDACDWYDQAYPDNDLSTAANRSGAHSFAALDAERRVAAATTEEQQQSASADYEVHRREEERWEAERMAALRRRMRPPADNGMPSNS